MPWVDMAAVPEVIGYVLIFNSGKANQHNFQLINNKTMDYYGFDRNYEKT